MFENNRFFVITGGPGSGKSTLIQALAAEGFQHMPEAGRAIIQDQVSIGGSALPWADRLAFAELMLSWEMRSYRAAQEFSGPVLFDRGVPDVVGYLKVCGLPVLPHITRAAHTYRYNPCVFVAPPWRAIFSEDGERKQSFEEAEATYEAMFQVYSELGYQLVSLPMASVPERLAFIRKVIAA
jgi:predicted ATPase